MKKLAIVAAAVAALFTVSAPVMAKKVDKATAYCQKLAKKHHVTADKVDSYMKSCVQKHHKHHKKVAAKKHAAKPAVKPAAPAAEAPAANM